MIYLTLYNLILLVNDSLQVINFHVRVMCLFQNIFASFLHFLLSHKLYYNNITI